MATSIALLLAGAITEVGLATKQSPHSHFCLVSLPQRCAVPQGRSASPTTGQCWTHPGALRWVPGPAGAPGDNEHTNGVRLLISIFHFFSFPQDHKLETALLKITALSANFN